MEGFRSEAELEEFLARPSAADIAAVGALEGDFLILGAGGKMGPTLAMRIQRAINEAGTGQCVTAVSRFSDPQAKETLKLAGVEIRNADLLNKDSLDNLPNAANVIYLVGRKFGSTGNAGLTWAMNVLVPGRVAEHFAESRIAALSSGNIYPLMPLDSGGARETDSTGPVGEYAQTVLGRERVFEYASETFGTRVVNLRLNYALELRYGILADIGGRVWNGESIDVTMPAVNFIWQGDANSYVLQSLAMASSPSSVLNIAGADMLRVRDIALEFGKRWNKPVELTGVEAPTALLNNGSLCHEHYGAPSVSWRQMLDWTADWIERGGRSLGKPTHFEVRDGMF